MAADTPKHWSKYLEYIKKTYKQDIFDWETTCIKEVEEWQSNPWFAKIMFTEDDLKQHHSWMKPELSDRKYKPSLISYYNWDVTGDAKLRD